MFKEIRNIKRKLSQEAAEEILTTSEYGVLATIGKDNYPYTTPLNYVYLDNAIYFHCALEGHKLENISYNNKVSFNVIKNTNILEKVFSTAYESTIVFGKAFIVEDAGKKRNALEALVNKYAPAYKEAGLKYIDNDIHKCHVIKIEIEHISAKGRTE